VRLEGLGQLENPVISSGIEPATFVVRSHIPKLTHSVTSFAIPSVEIIHRTKRVTCVLPRSVCITKLCFNASLGTATEFKVKQD
jgi:hypothetical protein